MKTIFLISFSIIVTVSSLAVPLKDPQKELKVYQENLALLRKTNPNVRQMPAIQFFLFGMGDRTKLLYYKGELKESRSGKILDHWSVKEETVVPSAYQVHLVTTANKKICIEENEKGVFIYENGKKIKTLAESNISLPDFKGKKFAPLLKVLHHEILININDGQPVPNYMVYKKPWFRDAALMGMVLKETNNLRLIKEWVDNIQDPFDRNNHGISEADNLGQVLFLVSLVSDKNHPVVKVVLDSLKQFEKGDYIEGKTDYALHPVFQTKWLKYGLKSLGLQHLDKYNIPQVYDSYSSLFWWDYIDQHVAGARFNDGDSNNYPYLIWAQDHFFGEHKGIVTDKEYPLSWEAFASDADYNGMKVLDPLLTEQKLSLPHTWHAAEMFLYLIME